MAFLEGKQDFDRNPWKEAEPDLEAQDSEALLTGANGAASGTAAGKPKGTFSKMCACLSAEYYQHLFDVDAAEVGQRMLSTLIPWKPALESSVRERPDLYSPLWIMCTLGFSLAAAYNFGNWTASDGTTYSYDFSIVPYACLFVACVFTLGPLLLWLMSRNAANDLQFVDVMCLFGYTQLLLIPTCFVCVAPSNLVRWLFAVVAALLSTNCLVINLNSVLALKGCGPKQRRSTVGTAALLQLSIVLLLKLLFF